MLMNDNEDDINIPDESIKAFINHCQNHQINLTTNNVLFIYKLAKKFIVPSLITAAEVFIFKGNENLIIEFLIISEDHQEVDTQKYEEVIAKDLIEYIKDNKLMSLPLPILHRIVSKFQNIIQKNDSKSEIPSEFIEFLFNCLDCLGQKASVLFSNFNFGRSNGKVIYRLLNEYSEIFDFHFINALQLKNVYSIESNLIQRDEKMKNEIAELKIENEKLKQAQKEMNKKIEELFQKHQDDEDKQNKLKTQIHAEMKKEISLIQEQQRDKNERKRKQINKDQSEINDQIKHVLQVQEEIKRDFAKQNEFKKEVNHQLKLQQDQMMKKIDMFIQGQKKEINEIKSEIQTNVNNINDFLNQQKEIDNTIKIMKDQNNNYQNDIKVTIDSIIKKQNSINKRNKSLINQIQSNMNNYLNSKSQDNNSVEMMIEKLKNEVDEIRKEFRNMSKSKNIKNEIELNSLNEQVSDSTESDVQQSDSINLPKREIKPKNFRLLRNFQFSKESGLKGILSIYGSKIQLIAGGNNSPQNPIENIKKNDSSDFFNNYFYSPKFEDSYIKFDFGKSKRVSLDAYFIKSKRDVSSNHPKKWYIEGSNDNSNWTMIDKRENEQSFIKNDEGQANFECNSKSKNIFRYIRYVQEEKHRIANNNTTMNNTIVNHNDYIIHISFFELYGSVYEIEN